MTPTEWFRSPDWDQAAERDFRDRLARSRPHNRVQYRRIKADALLRTGDPAKEIAGRQLLMEVTESADAPDFEKVMALSMLGRAALRDGRLDDAEANLRQALRIAGANGSGTSGLEEAWLAQVALARNDHDALRQARVLLEQRAANPPAILSAGFEICLTAARVASALDDPRGAASWAVAALDLADRDHSGLANHPRPGLVSLDPETREWLERTSELR